MPSATVTSKGQITIPKKIRELLNLETGDRVDFVIEGDRVLLRPGTGDLRALRGLLHRPGQAPVSVEAMADAIARVHGKRT